MSKKIVCRILLTSFGALCITAAKPATFSFQSTFQSDDQLQAFFLRVSERTTVGILSLGYGGGTTFDGATVSGGGFDSYLTLVTRPVPGGATPGGLLITENDDGQFGTIDSATGQSFDAGIMQVLDPGTYMAILSQYGNSFVSDRLFYGFSQAGNPTFTSDLNFAPGGPCPTSYFRDSSGSAGRCRNGSYTLEFSGVSEVSATYSDILSLPPSPTPEPGTFWLLVPVLGLLRYLNLRRPKALVRN